MLKRIGVLASLSIVAATACSGSDEVSSDTAVSSEPTASLDEFCEQYELPQGERPESYVGSQEQIEDIENLRTVALDAVSKDLSTFSDYLSSGAIDSQADPDSNLIENWPEDVQTAVEKIQAFGTETC